MPAVLGPPLFLKRLPHVAANHAPAKLEEKFQIVRVWVRVVFRGDFSSEDVGFSVFDALVAVGFKYGLAA